MIRSIGLKHGRRVLLLCCGLTVIHASSLCAVETVDRNITFEASQGDDIKRTAPALFAMRDLLFFYFGPVDDSGLKVMIVASRNEFDALLGSGFPDWGAAAALPRRRLIVLQSPSILVTNEPFAQIVRHEYAHIYLHLLAGPGARIPRWLDEGFSLHAAFEWTLGRYFRLARASLTNRLLSLRELESVNGYGGERAALAYTQAFAAYQLLERDFGREGVIRLIELLGKGYSIDRAFQDALDISYVQFQKNVDRSIRQKYNMISLITNTGFWWGILALLIIVGWAFKKRQTREIERRWNIEDRIHGEANFDEYVDPDDDESWRT